MPADSPWFLTSLSSEATARLFCFPYSGCGASMYRAWPRWVGSVEIVPLQLPGRENRMREPHYGTYEKLASALVADIGPYLDRPYALFGHCGGALPAAEPRCNLRRRVCLSRNGCTCRPRWLRGRAVRAVLTLDRERVGCRVGDV